MKNRFIILISIIIYSYFSISFAYSLDPNKNFEQYIMKKWGLENGLPQNSISCLLQTSDGYIWFGTQEGLVRYDGVNFKIFDISNSNLNGNSIMKLIEDKEGILWIATDFGVYYYKNRKFREIKFNGNPISQVFDMIQDNEGRIWICGGFSVFLYYNNKLFKKYPIDSNKSSIECISLAENKDNEILMLKFSGELLKYNPKIDRFEKLNIDNEIKHIFTDTDKNLYLNIKSKGLNIYKKDKIEPYQFKDKSQNYDCHIVLKDSHGNNWFGLSNGGLLRDNDNQILDSEQYIVKTMIEDKEGNLWLGTNKGLIKLSDGKFTTVVYDEENIFHTIFKHKDNIYIVYNNIFLKIKNGVKTKYIFEGETNEDLKHTYNRFSMVEILSISKDGTIIFITPLLNVYTFKNGIFTKIIDKRKIPKDINLHNCHLCSNKKIWITCSKGLLCYENNKLTHYTIDNGFPAKMTNQILEDKNGNIWIGSSDGIFLFKNNQFRSFNLEGGFGVPFFIDDKGNVWGGGTKGTFRIIDNKVEYITEKYLKMNAKDKNNVNWFCGQQSSLFKFKNEKLVEYNYKDGILNSNGIHTINIDNNDNLWLSSNKGIINIEMKDINLYDSKKINKIPYKYFDKSDGLPSKECNAGSGSGTEDENGTIYFDTIKGVCSINPSKIKTNKIIPFVHIDELTIDGKKRNHRRFIYFDNDTKDYEIKYTSLSFTNPKRVYFKYKMEGFDKDWINAGTKRETKYTNLPTGVYTFRVIACNNDGLWNKKGASFSFEVLPAFWQTWWFIGICIVILLFIVAIIILLATYRIRKRKEQLEVIVKQRTKELQERHKIIHDNLLYAEKLQNAILPFEDEISKITNEYFLIWKEKDIVGGDFYWFYEIPNSNRFIISVLDCTGHGVPGAFMTMIGNSLLNMIVKEQKTYQPNIILQQLHEGVREALQQKDTTGTNQYDGMDASLCLVDKDKKEIQIASAKGIVYKYQDNKIERIKGDNKSIGGKQKENIREFSLFKIGYSKELVLYLLTDGLIDQSGKDKDGKKIKFSSRRWKEWLKENVDLPLNEQKTNLLKTIEDFQQDLDQRDDITVLGIKLN